jgi:hypothetical protein
MTTDNTATETAPLTPIQIAEEFVKENSSATIVEEFVNNYNAIESLKKQLEYCKQEVVNQRSRWASMAETIEEFLKSHISEGDSASVDDLKELADQLDIELTKSITVKMEIQVEIELTVPLDFDEESIDDSDFDISCDFNGMTDVDVDDTNIEITSCEVEEN